jgi:hypothetical protein
VGELQVCWKYVINHVRNSGNTCPLDKKDRCHFMLSSSLIHRAPHNWSMLDLIEFWDDYEHN